MPWRWLRPVARHWLGWAARAIEAQGFAGVARAPAPRRPTTTRGRGPPCDAPLTVCTVSRGPHGRADRRPSPTGLPRCRGREPPAPGVLGCWCRSCPFDDPLSTVVLDRDGELLGASIAADGQWRFGVADVGAGEVRGGDHLLRGPAVLLAPRGGPPGPRARGGPQPPPGPRGERRQHAHHAGRAPLPQGPAAHARREGDRGHPRAPAHAVALEAAGARPLRRLRALRRQHGGPRRGGLALLRPRRPAALVGGDGDARRAAERPRPRPPRPQPRPPPREAQPPPRRAPGAGRDRRDDRGPREARAAAARPGAAPHARPPPGGAACGRSGRHGASARGTRAPGCARRSASPSRSA